MGNKEYKYKVGQYVNVTLKVVKQIRVKSGKNKTEKGYLVQSIVYPNAEPYEINEYKLKNGVGCAYLAGKRICAENSLYSIKHLRRYIIDISEAKNTTKFSHRKILLRCTCGKEKVMAVHNLVVRGFSCQNCSKGTPYPELFMLAYLQVKSIPHETQVKYDDLGLRRYDFRIKLNGVTFLLETHGAQHFFTEDVGYHKVKTIQESDVIKRNYAKDNNINYIELDCRKSTFKFIRNSIEESVLPNINNEEIEPILELIEINSKYDTKEIIRLYELEKMSIQQIADKLNVGVWGVRSVLLENNIKLLPGSGRLKKMVRCIETGILYESAADAARQIGIKANGKIAEVCNGKRQSTGKHPVTGEKLTWEWEENYPKAN